MANMEKLQARVELTTKKREEAKGTLIETRNTRKLQKRAQRKLANAKRVQVGIARRAKKD